MTIANLVAILGACGAFIVSVSTVLSNRASRKRAGIELENKRETDLAELQRRAQSDILTIQNQFTEAVSKLTESACGMVELLQSDLIRLNERLAMEHGIHVDQVRVLQSEIERLRVEIDRAGTANVNHLRIINGDG